MIRDKAQAATPPASHSVKLAFEPADAERLMAILLDAQSKDADMPPDSVSACISAACQIQRQLQAVTT